MREKILELRAQGYTYNQIVEELSCAKSTVAYHCGDGQKEKSLARNKVGKLHAVREKLYRFKYRIKTDREKPVSLSLPRSIYMKVDWFQRTLPENLKKFTVVDFLESFENKTYCYLTGDKIDFNKPSDFHFDHIVPISKGGSSEISNLGLATKQANLMKSDLTVEELLEMCIKILKNFDIIEEV